MNDGSHTGRDVVPVVPMSGRIAFPKGFLVRRRLLQLLLLVLVAAGAASSPVTAGPFDGPEPGYHVKLNDRLGLALVSGFEPGDSTLSLTRLGPSGVPVEPLWAMHPDADEKFLLELRLDEARPERDDGIWWNKNCVAVRRVGNDAGTPESIFVVDGRNPEIVSPAPATDSAKAFGDCGLEGAPSWRTPRQAYYETCARVLLYRFPLI